jgi:hypothetical protein
MSYYNPCTALLQHKYYIFAARRRACSSTPLPISVSAAKALSNPRASSSAHLFLPLGKKNYRNF